MIIRNKMLTKLLSYKEQNQIKLNLWMNYILVACAFVIPINDRAFSFLAFLIMILVILRGNFKIYFSLIAQNKVVLSFIYFFIIYLTSLLYSSNLEHGIDILKHIKYALFLPILLSFVNIRFSKTIIAAFLGGMFFSELLSYSIYFKLIPSNFIINGVQIYSAYAQNDPSPFMHHSHYGALLALSVAIISYKVFSTYATTSNKIIFFIFLSTMSINIFITGGRTGHLLYFILIAIVIFILRKQIKFTHLLFVFIAITTIVTIQYKSDTSVFKQRSLETIQSFQNIDSYNSSLGNRIGIWTYSYETIKNNPIIGVGIGDSLDEVFKNIDNKHAYLKNMAHFHNQYIEVLIGTGLIGLCLFLNIFLQIYRYFCEDLELKFVMILLNSTIFFALMIETFHMKVYFSIWIVLLAATMAHNKEPLDKENNQFKEIKIYIFLILIALTIGKMQ